MNINTQKKQSYVHNAEVYLGNTPVMNQRNRSKQERLRCITDCLSSFDSNRTKNLKKVLHVCGDIFQAEAVFFSSVSNESVEIVEQWYKFDQNILPHNKSLEQSLWCTHSSKQKSEKNIIQHNLQQCPHCAHTDLAGNYNFELYNSFSVESKQGQHYVVCLLYSDKISFTQDDNDLFEIVSVALKSEYDRGIEHYEEVSQKVAAITEEKWKTIFYSLPGGTFLINDEYKLENVNDFTCELTGYSREELLNQPCSILCGTLPDQYPAFSSQKTHLDNFESLIRTKYGKTIPIMKSVRKVHFNNKDFIIENFQDISEKKQAEQELIQYKKQLESILDKKTKELHDAYRRLRHSEKMQAIGRLAGGIAHDINNQLAGILGYTEIVDLNLRKSNSALANYTTSVMNCVDKSAALITKLLAFARKARVKKSSFNIHDLLKEGITSTHNKVNQKTILSTDFSSHESTVTGDYNQLLNVISSIILNANEAMHDGGHLCISTSYHDFTEEYCHQKHLDLHAGSYIKIDISDTGVGISPELQKHVFEPFFTTKEDGEGTGLELSAAYGIIKNHNGLIHLESEVNKGTTFTIYLPFEHERDLTEDEIMKVHTRPPIQLPQEKKNILVVDDEPIVKDLLCEILKMNNYNPISFEDGFAAIDYFRKNFATVDAVILDMIMPRIDGIEVFTQLRSILPNVKVIISSGFTVDFDTDHLLELGIADVIQKPYTGEGLIKIVKKVLSQNIENCV